MANILGVPEYDPSLDRLNMQLQSQAIQQLGAQVRADLTQIQTNRQLQGFSQGLQGLSTQSPDFGRGVVGLMTQYPLAAHSPVGQAAINTLGAEHKAWQQGLLHNQNVYSPVAGTDVILNRQTGDTTVLPEGSRPVKPIQIGKNTTGIYTPGQDYATPVDQLGLPMPTITDPVSMEETKQANRLELLDKKLSNQISPELKRLSTEHSRLLELYSKKDAEAKKYASLWEGLGDPNDPAKWKAGLQATGIRAEADAIGKQLQQVESQLKGTANQVIQSQAVNPEGLIPSIPAPSTAPKRRVFNPSTLQLE
jgi:hypothetical protein